MKKSSRLLVVISVALVALVVLSGCGQYREPSVDDSTPAEKPSENTMPIYTPSTDIIPETTTPTDTTSSSLLVPENICINDFQVLEIEGSYDGTDQGLHMSELSLGVIDASQIPSEATVTILGKTYFGTYRDSYTSDISLLVEHRYRGEGGTFTINAKTGECSSFVLKQDISTHATLTYDQCKEAADAFAKNYIDLSKYKTEVAIYESYSNYYYSVTYYREISGLKTSDRLLVSVDGNGNIKSFGCYDLHAFENVASVQIDQTKLTAAIESKLNTIYQNVPTRIGYEADDIILLRLPNGSIGFRYRIINRFQYVSEGKIAGSYSSVLELLVMAQ